MASGWRAGCARGIEAHVIHPARVAVSREHWRAKTDRLDTEQVSRRQQSVSTYTRHAVPLCTVLAVGAPQDRRENSVMSRLRPVGRAL
jgi:transposase